MINVRFSKKSINDVYLPFVDNEDRFLVFYGGGSSGKSFFIGQRIVYHLLSKKRCNYLIVRQTADTNRKSTFPLIKQVIKKGGLASLFKINESDMRIRCMNGNEIAFAGLDDVEKIKSITFESGELTHIWIEEATETSEEDINQLKVRLRGGSSNKQMILSFNPINIQHWIKRHFVDSGLATCCFSTYKDNKFLSEQDKQALEDLKLTDPYVYSVYCLGEWGILGQGYFDNRIVQARLENVPKPLKIGYYTYSYQGNVISNIKWVDDEQGFIKIYQDKTDDYTAFGVDTASEGIDFNCGHILDRQGNQIAVIHKQIDEDLFAKQVYCLGTYYNSYIGVEVNHSTYLNNKLLEWNYDKFYWRETFDAITNQVQKKIGFRTTQQSRNEILSSLKELVREHSNLINDSATLNEMLTFVDIKGKPQASENAHDDLVMSLAISYKVLEQLPIKIERKEIYNEEDSFFSYGT